MIFKGISYGTDGYMSKKKFENSRAPTRNIAQIRRGTGSVYKKPFESTRNVGANNNRHVDG